MERIWQVLNAVLTHSNGGKVGTVHTSNVPG